MSTATIKTAKGDMTVEFFDTDAPLTVANFCKLAKSGFYDGLTFHRVLPNFVIQGGCPKGTGTGDPAIKSSAKRLVATSATIAACFPWPTRARTPADHSSSCVTAVKAPRTLTVSTPASAR